jgi:hypothetical protein
LGYETCLIGNTEELAFEKQLGIDIGRAVIGVAPGRLTRMKSEPGPPMTLGGAAAAQVRLIVWCKDCRHQVSPIPPRSPPGVAPKRPCSISASGWSVLAAAAGRPIWWRAARDKYRSFPIGSR